MKNKYIEEPARSLECVAEAEVVVAGGGPAGVAAAVAAARAGARTILLESFGFLGGMATAGLVGGILGVTAHRGERKIVGGILREIADQLHRLGGSPAWEDVRGGLAFDSELLKIVLDEVTGEAGVDVLLHAFVADAIVEDGEIRALVIESKSGRQAVSGRLFIDATGDADIAARAGVPTLKGRDADGASMAMGSCYHLGGVDTAPAEEIKKARAYLQEKKNSGEWRVYNCGGGGQLSTWGRPERSVNATRAAGDCTSVRDLTRAEIEIRRETLRSVQYFREHMPGYGKCYLSQLPAHVGLRESRRIVGGYALTGDDIRNGAQFPDQVALGSWWIDIHCPLGRTDGEIHLCMRDCPADPPCTMLTDHADQLPGQLYPPENGAYGIPYRCLVPEGIDNLLVAGRCLSATHEGVAGARVIGTCFAMGQAAGTAAAMAAAEGKPPREIDTGRLREKIRAAGGILD